MIIDFHTHILPPEVIRNRADFAKRDAAFALLYEDPRSRIVTAEGLIEAMDRDGVERAGVCGFPWADQGICAMTNDYLLEAQQRFPDRLFSFYTPSSSGGRESARRAAEALERGMRGIGEVGFYSSGMGKRQWRWLQWLGEAACAAGAPLLLHVNESVGHQYPGKTDMRLRDLWRFIEEKGDLLLVLAHWGGGLFFYELMKSVRKEVRDLYYDTAASPYLYLPEVYRIGVEIVGADRILFGSDYPLIRPSRYFREMEAGGLTGEARRKILGENAARLLHLDHDS